MSTAGTREDKHMDDTERMARLAEVIEELTGTDFDTAAQLAQEAIGKAKAMRALEDGTHMDTFTIYAEDGEYSEQATDIGEALAQFRRRYPDCFVSAVVNDGMRPRLVIEDPS